MMKLAIWAPVMMVVSALAQVSGGGIGGRVVDALGGAVQDALVTMESQSTGEVRSLKTNERGFYSFPNLAPGRYNAVVSHAGFGDFAKRNIVVAVGGELLIDFEIAVGGTATSVEVSAQSPEASLT